MKKVFRSYVLVFTFYLSLGELFAQATNKIDTVGDVGIGTTLPAFKLDVRGDFRVRNSTVSGSSYTTFRIQGGNVLEHGLEIDFFGDPGRGTDYGTYYAGYGGGAIVNVNAKPLVLGTANLPRMFISGEGFIGIGTISPSEKLSVNGNISSKKSIVTQTGWSDYVFNDDYKLKPLNQVEKFIKDNKHLPEVPSAKEVEEKGLDLGANQAVLLKKIEELTLYIIEMDKKQDQMLKKNKEMKVKIQQLMSHEKVKK